MAKSFETKLEQDFLYEIYLNKKDAPLYITTRIEWELIKARLNEFKKTDDYIIGQFTDETIIEFLQDEYYDVEPYDIFPSETFYM